MFDLFYYDANLGSYDSLEEACVALYRNFNCSGLSLCEENTHAWTSDGNGLKKNGRWLNTLEMLHCGARLSALWNSYEYHNSDRFRQGSVRGIRKWRGGSGYYRRMRTMAERRQNLGVVSDEGPALVRPTRNNLPNNWDDYGRTRDRNWKAQHRGHKSWDKVVLA